MTSLRCTAQRIPFELPFAETDIDAPGYGMTAADLIGEEVGKSPFVSGNDWRTSVTGE